MTVSVLCALIGHTPDLVGPRLEDGHRRVECGRCGTPLVLGVGLSRLEYVLAALSVGFFLVLIAALAWSAWR